MSHPKDFNPMDGDEPSAQLKKASAVSRRAVTRTAAWSIPLIAAVAAAPLAAASPVGGAIVFDYPEYIVGPSMTYGPLTGKVIPAVGAPMPSVVALTYPSGWTGPATAVVDPATGMFSVSGVTAPGAVGSGPLTATAGLIAGNTALTVATNVVPPAVDGVVWGDNDLDILYFASSNPFQTYAVTPNSLTGAGTLAPASIVALAGGYRG